TVEVDVTELHRACRVQERSLFAAMLWRLVRAANRVPELRQRVRTDDGEYVVQHDHVDPGFTVAAADGLFSYATTPLVNDEIQFAANVAEVSAPPAGPARLGAFEGQRDDLVFMSCLPWLRFSGLVQPMRQLDTVPRIAWGRITRAGERSTAPVSLQAHHALVDGQHVASFFAMLEQELTGDLRDAPQP
ncbi:MAG: chloramphenicol O-acetyltransferase type A, partial [Kiritimatiellia bacterium]